MPWWWLSQYSIWDNLGTGTCISPRKVILPKLLTEQQVFIPLLLLVFSSYVAYQLESTTKLPPMQGSWQNLAAVSIPLHPLFRSSQIVLRGGDLVCWPRFIQAVATVFSPVISILEMFLFTSHTPSTPHSPICHMKKSPAQKKLSTHCLWRLPCLWNVSSRQRNAMNFPVALLPSIKSWMTLTQHWVLLCPDLMFCICSFPSWTT